MSLTKRSYRGNRNYLSFYNREVEEFFDNESVEYEESKINLLGAVVHGSHRSFKHFIGSRWTSKEKNQFFKSISRHSIHDIHAVQQEIGSKSVVEIYAYYELLKKELNYHKNKHTSRSALTRKAKIANNKIYTYKQHNPDLLSYKEFPISHEMTPSFLRFEEVQSTLILRKEYLRINDSNKFFKRFDGDMDKFFNLPRLQELLRLYKALGKEANPQHQVKMSVLFVMNMEAIVRHITTEMMLKVINVFRPGKSHDRDITADHIKRHVGFNENFWNKYLYESWKFQRLGIQQEDILHNMKEVVPRKELPLVLGKRFSEPNNLADAGNKVLSIEDLPRYNPDQTNKPFKEMMEYELFVLETAELDSSDKIESENEQHKLLTFFSTANYDGVKDSMYSEDQMEQFVAVFKARDVRDEQSRKRLAENHQVERNNNKKRSMFRDPNIGSHSKESIDTGEDQEVPERAFTESKDGDQTEIFYESSSGESEVESDASDVDLYYNIESESESEDSETAESFIPEDVRDELVDNFSYHFNGYESE